MGKRLKILFFVVYIICFLISCTEDKKSVENSTYPESISLSESIVSTESLEEQKSERGSDDSLPLMIYYNNRIYYLKEEHSVLSGMNSYEITKEYPYLGEIQTIVKETEYPTYNFSANFGDYSNYANPYFDIYRYEEDGSMILTTCAGRIQIWSTDTVKYNVNTILRQEIKTGEPEFIFRYEDNLYKLCCDSYFLLMGMRAFEIDDNCICLGTIDAEKTVSIYETPMENLTSNFAQNSFNIYQYDQEHEKLIVVDGNYIGIWERKDGDPEKYDTGLYIKYDGKLYERSDRSYPTLMGVDADNIGDKCNCLGIIDSSNSEADIIPVEDFSSNIGDVSFEIYQYDNNNTKLITVEEECIVLWECISE